MVTASSLLWVTDNLYRMMMDDVGMSQIWDAGPPQQMHQKICVGRVLHSDREIDLGTAQNNPTQNQVFDTKDKCGKPKSKPSPSHHHEWD